MTKLNYTQKVEQVLAWVDLINEHWHRLEGDIFDDKAFWQECIHSKTNDDWWVWIDIVPALKAQYPDSFNRYPYCELDVAEITKRLHKAGSKPINRPGVKGKNFAVFRALMNMKDVINDANGTPTKQYPKKPKPQETNKDLDRKLLHFTSLFEIKQ